MTQPFPKYEDHHELFKLIAEGDEVAFTTIFWAYTKRLYPFVLKLVNSDLWAEEIVQDVFSRLWERRETLKGIDNPTTYLFRMASNRTLDYIRRNELHVKMQYILAREKAEENRELTAELVDLKASEQLLKAAIHSLPPQRKLVYQLKHEENLSYDEIADRLKISRNTVRNHMAEALQAIRTYLRLKGDIIGLLLLYWHQHH